MKVRFCRSKNQREGHSEAKSCKDFCSSGGELEEEGCQEKERASSEAKKTWKILILSKQVFCGEREMDHQSDEAMGIKVYNALPPSGDPPAEGGRRIRAAVGDCSQKISEKIVMLHRYFLPATGTYFFFNLALPFIDSLMIPLLLGLCAVSCFVFHFIDSFQRPDGAVYYGFVVTPKGLSVFERGLKIVHAIMLVMVFVATALSDHRVRACFFPGHQIQMGSGEFPIYADDCFR